jgi:hypothetical protein
MLTSRVLAAALCLTVTAACTTRLPPPPTPSRRAPSASLPSSPSPAGDGRIVIETEDGPATAELVTGRSVGVAYGGGHTAVASHLATRRLCTTPCAVDLPYGEHEVILTIDGTDKVAKVVARVEEGPQHLITAMGRYKPRSGRAVGGGVLMLLGGSVALAATPFALSDDFGDGADYLLYGSIAATAIGALLVAGDRSTVQDASYAQYAIE